MKIDRLELIHLKLPLVHFFETSFGRVYDKETIIVRLESDGFVGYGESPAAAAPDYSYETVQTVWHVTEEFLAPTLRKADIQAAGSLEEPFSLVRGHPMAKAGVEMALTDLFAKKEDKPLWRLLGGERKEVPTGISLGIQDSPEQLLDHIGEAVNKGYQRIKIKIKRGWDLEILAAVRETFPDTPLMVDANAAYTLADTEHLRAMDEFNLMMMEQPLDHGDMLDHAELQTKIKTPICLDESIKDPGDARRALAMNACRIINIKQARVGGPFAAKEIHDLALKKGVAVWCGGLLESGIGRLHNVALSTLPNFTLPGDVSASERYYREEIVDPPVTITAKGTIEVLQKPGIGAEVREDILNKFAVRREAV